MASTIAELMVSIGGDISDLEKSISKGMKKIEQAGKSMTRVGRKMTTRITAPLGALGGVALKTAADFEGLQQSMSILNGSVEEGARNFERLKRFSARTPFRLKGLASAQNMLQGFGLSADRAFESLSMIGDIAAVTGGNINSIGVAFGQAAAEGRVMSRDIRQFINNDVPAIKLLAETMGVAEGAVFDLASQGKITFDILVEAFQDATEEGGQFANGMEKQSNTLHGLWSTLRDNVDQFMAEIGNSIVDAFNLKQVIKDLTANLRTITDRFSELSADTQRQVVKIAGFFAAGGPILIALGQAAIAVSAFSKLVRTRFFMITAAAGLVAGTIEQQRQLWTKLFSDSEKAVDNFTTSAQKGIMKVIGPVMEFSEEILGAGAALDSFQNLLSGLGGAGAENINNLLGNTKDLISFINGDVHALSSNLESASEGFSDMGKESGEFQFTFSSPIEKITEFQDNVRNLDNIYGKSIDSMKASGAEFATVTEAALGQSLSNWEKFNVSVKNVSESFKTEAIQQIQSAVLSFGEIIGKTLSGVENTFSTTFEKIVLILLDFAGSLVKLAAGIGALMLFIPGMQGVGGGILAASAALQGVISGVESGIEKRMQNREERQQEREGNTPALASGGLAYGPTLAMVGDNINAQSDPEVIAPLSKLEGMGGSRKVEVTGNLRGDTIYLANARGQNKFR